MRRRVWWSWTVGVVLLALPAHAIVPAKITDARQLCCLIEAAQGEVVTLNGELAPGSSGHANLDPIGTNLRSADQQCHALLEQALGAGPLVNCVCPTCATPTTTTSTTVTTTTVTTTTAAPTTTTAAPTTTTAAPTTTTAAPTTTTAPPTTTTVTSTTSTSHTTTT